MTTFSCKENMFIVVYNGCAFSRLVKRVIIGVKIIKNW